MTILIKDLQHCFVVVMFVIRRCSSFSPFWSVRTLESERDKSGSLELIINITKRESPIEMLRSDMTPTTSVQGTDEGPQLPAGRRDSFSKTSSRKLL